MLRAVEGGKHAVCPKANTAIAGSVKCLGGAETSQHFQGRGVRRMRPKDEMPRELVPHSNQGVSASFSVSGSTAFYRFWLRTEIMEEQTNPQGLCPSSVGAPDLARQE